VSRLKAAKKATSPEFARYRAADHDIRQVVLSYLGDPVPRRRGNAVESGEWWHCPNPGHEDANPSMEINETKSTWRCHGCHAHGSAVDIVMLAFGCDFIRAKNLLEGRDSNARPAAKKAPSGPITAPVRRESLLDAARAQNAAQEAKWRLWDQFGKPDLDHLHGRGLHDETIRRFHLGSYSARKTGNLAGVAVGWFDQAGLEQLRVRRRDDQAGSKYLVVYRRDPILYASFQRARRGAAVIVAEGELDVVLLWQELGGKTSVCTAGSSGDPIVPAAIERLAGAGTIHIATDNDGGGHAVAARWTHALGDGHKTIRILPPDPYNDWTDAHAGGVNLREFWAPILAEHRPGS
jgi:DNA primase